MAEMITNSNCLRKKFSRFCSKAQSRALRTMNHPRQISSRRIRWKQANSCLSPYDSPHWRIRVQKEPKINKLTRRAQLASRRMPNLLKLKPKSLHSRKLLCSAPQQLRQKQLFNRKDKLTRKQKVKIKDECPQGTVISFRVNKVARLRLQSFKRVEMRRKNLTKQ